MVDAGLRPTDPVRWWLAQRQVSAERQRQRQQDSNGGGGTGGGIEVVDAAEDALGGGG